MPIWGSDADGHLGRGETKPEQYNNTIGPYTLKKTPGKGNAIQLAHQFIRHYMIPMNTWKRPKLTKMAKGKYKRLTPEHTKRAIEK